MSDDIIINLVPTYSHASIYDDVENIFGNGTITIDYGDGTTETYTGIIEHSYNDNDNHTITISGANRIGDFFLNYNMDYHIHQFLLCPFSATGALCAISH